MIIISPYSKALNNGNTNPKNYPFWAELIAMIEEPIVQIGIEGEVQLVEDFRKGLPISQLKELLHECRTWISCDSFFQHLGWIEGKKGIVLEKKISKSNIIAVFTGRGESEVICEVKQ